MECIYSIAWTKLKKRKEVLSKWSDLFLVRTSDTSVASPVRVFFFSSVEFDLQYGVQSL